MLMESVRQDFSGMAHPCSVMSGVPIGKTQLAGAWNHLVTLHVFGAWAEKAKGLAHLGAYDFSM